MSVADEPRVTHHGGCHCGAVRFAVDAPARLVVHQCNCSICRMTGFLHLIVERSAFRLLRGKDGLRSYRFNTGAAEHLFCSTCGIKSFYRPRSHPDGYSVHAGCLDQDSIEALQILPFDGANWEASIDGLKSEGQPRIDPQG